MFELSIHINIAMQIEKIANPKVDLSSPGLVDLFYDDELHKHSNIYFSNMFPNLCKTFQKELRDKWVLGPKYGRPGIPLIEVLATPSDIYYEICGRSLQALPTKHIKVLLKNYNLIIHDYIEGPQWLTADVFSNGGNPVDFIKTLDIIPRNVIIATCGGENYDVKELNIKTGFLPLWLMLVHSERAIDLQFNFNPQKLALVPARKARHDRVRLMARLYEQNLLDKCDWSLLLNFEDNGAVGDFFKSPSLSSKRWHLLQTSEEKYIQTFYQDHKNILPKVFEQLPKETFKDNHAFDINWAGAYDYMISCETLTGPTGIFPTEKTFKGMMLGLPVLTLACQGFDNFLTSLGFKTLGDFDHLYGEERVVAIVEYLKQPVDREHNKSVAKWNFDLVHDKEFIVSLIQI